MNVPASRKSALNGPTRPRLARARGILAALTAVLCAFAAPGCREKADPSSPTQPRVFDMSRGHVQVTITADPPKVALDRDTFLTIKITSPSEIDVTLPPLEDRLHGFALSGSYGGDPSIHQGRITIEKHLRLTPVISDEYRIAPFAITTMDRSRNPAQSEWFATQPIVFERLPPLADKPDARLRSHLAPVWIHPPFSSVALWTLLAAGVIVLLFLLRKVFRKVHRHVQLMRMSPRERALRELAELVARDLIAKNLVKEFYLQLTMIVRRYVERRHRIRAPEQTTEEFLAAVSRDSRFGPDVIEKLKAFLEAADLVKFAAHRPRAGEVDQATGTARRYIESDSDPATTAAADSPAPREAPHV